MLTCWVLWEGLREADQAPEADAAHYGDTWGRDSVSFVA